MNHIFHPSRIYIAADHGGWQAKQSLLESLHGDYDMVDFGAEGFDPDDDFTPYAERVARQVAITPRSVGILLCRSGEGMAIAANKIDGIRAALVWNQEVARESRDDNDANVLTLPTDYLDKNEIEAIVRAWLTTPFSGANRHARRIAEIHSLEDTDK
ncbi:RpiB/LacA/LacB family sugar-phosphate isomerase [Candidatus Saccharibacteria bacterium]|nr:RpiB/LacA/LacB family sugar-phosphate isomerase [Candidatus Saccharibacteria bacterium]